MKWAENPLLVSTVLYTSKTIEETMKITLAVHMDEHFFEQLAAAIQMASYLQLVNGWWTTSEHNFKFAIVPSKEVETNAVKDGKQTQTQ